MIGSCCWSTWKSKEALLIAIERNKDMGFKAIGNDATLVRRIIDGYDKIQNESPDLIALDRGFYSKENRKILKEWGVKQVCLPKRGYKTKEEKAQEKQYWFKNLRKMRAGIEGRISKLSLRQHSIKHRTSFVEKILPWQYRILVTHFRIGIFHPILTTIRDESSSHGSASYLMAFLSAVSLNFKNASISIAY